MEGTSGKAIRFLIVALLLYGAYVVATCPCVDTELLKCKDHGATYYGALLAAAALVPIHHSLK
jgi:hypothetical protein